MSRLGELLATKGKIEAEIGFLKDQGPGLPDAAGETQCRMTDRVAEKSPEQIIGDLFTYHPPQDEATVLKYEAVREAAKHLAMIIWKTCPFGADRTAAIRKLREAVMTANASIALNGLQV